jgi:hypothetical protein
LLIGIWILFDYLPAGRLVLEKLVILSKEGVVICYGSWFTPEGEIEN